MTCYMYFIPQASSSYSDDPTDCTVFSSSILDSTLVVNEDQVIDEVGVPQPTCIMIHEDYDWELEHQSLENDDSLLFEPPPHFPKIFSDYIIPNFACVSLSTDAPIVDNS